MPALVPAFAPRPRRVTISQVAEAAGVARATAAFVISGRAPELRIAQKTIDRVNAVAKRLGYVRIACLGDTIETVEQSAQLTAIREPIREIGRAAAELVIEAIENPKLRPQERLIEAAELVVRPSTAGDVSAVR